MLSSELLRFKQNGDYLKPSFIDPSDPRLLHFASALLQLYENGTGSTRGTLDELTSGLLLRQKDLKLARGILKTLSDRAEFSSAGGSSEFPDLRRALFLKSASMLREGRLPPHPEDVRECVFRDFRDEDAGNSPPFRNGIYADLPEQETLERIRKTFPKELLERYNVSLVQSLILHASGLTLEIADSDPAKLRRLFRYLKFFRLLADVRLRKPPDESRIRLTVDGPASIFENSTKYGLQLASFFPAVCQMEQWKLSCEIRLRQKKKRLVLDSSCGLRSHYANFSAYIPEEIRLFAEHFRSTVPEWEIDSAPDYWKETPQKLVFPDFLFREKHHPGGKEFPMELFHRWHAAQLLERLSFLEQQRQTEEGTKLKKGEKHNEVPLLLIGVDRSLLKKDGLLKARLEESPYFQKHGFLFRDFPGVENVLKVLKRQS